MEPESRPGDMDVSLHPRYPAFQNSSAQPPPHRERHCGVGVGIVGYHRTLPEHAAFAAYCWEVGNPRYGRCSGRKNVEWEERDP